MVLAKNGMVATSHPLAAQVGLQILQDGGNAVDAAIAVNAMLGLVEPMSCGIGGDLFVIHWDAKTQKLYGLNASGRSPFSLNRDVFREKKLDQIPIDGPLSWSVPGCVDGWSVLQERFGKQDFKTVLAPAIHYGKEGVPVPEVIASYWKGGEKAFEKWPDSADTYLIDGKAPRFGEVFKNPRLAATYQTLADKGRDAFYKGAIAEEIVKFSEAHGGYFQRKDLEEHTSTWVEPVSTNYRGYEVYE
ncbi:MAG: gamma-glutamyltransferase, partial [Planctomycetaceae bacterium]|nr:gamma-glutamyltransferase [Planctomycetaceae bacterium]